MSVRYTSEAWPSPGSQAFAMILRTALKRMATQLLRHASNKMTPWLWHSQTVMKTP